MEQDFDDEPCAPSVPDDDGTDVFEIKTGEWAPVEFFAPNLGDIHPLVLEISANLLDSGRAHRRQVTAGWRSE
jgi:hypothetical protein